MDYEVPLSKRQPYTMLDQRIVDICNHYSPPLHKEKWEWGDECQMQMVVHTMEFYLSAMFRAEGKIWMPDEPAHAVDEGYKEAWRQITWDLSDDD